MALGRRDAEIRGDQPGSGIAATFASHIDPSLTWDVIAWMHSVTSLPIFVKVSCTAALQEQWPYISCITAYCTGIANRLQESSKHEG